MPKIATQPKFTTPTDGSKKANTSDDIIASAVAEQLDRALETLTPTARHGAIPDDLLTSTLAETTKEVKIKKKERKERAPKTIPADSDRCIARTWGGQCKSVKCGDGQYPDLCKGCSAKATVCFIPNSFDKDTVNEGDTKPKRIGLRFGTINQSLTDLIFAPNGDIASVWPDDQVRSLVDQALKQGKKYHPGSKEGSAGKTSVPRKKKEKKEKPPKTKRGKNAYMFFLEVNRASIKADLEKSESYVGQTVPVTAVTKSAGAKWKALSESERVPWVEMAQQDALAKKLAVEEDQSSMNLNDSEDPHIEPPGTNLQGGQEPNVDKGNQEAEQKEEEVEDEEEADEEEDAEQEEEAEEEVVVEEAHEEDSAATNIRAEIKAGIPEGGIGKMKVPELRMALEKMCLDSSGLKAVLVERLEKALQDTSEEEEEAVDAVEISLEDGRVVYYVDSNKACYTTDESNTFLGTYDEETNNIKVQDC